MIRLETKAAFTVDDVGMISGTAWPFGSPDRVGDTIAKGAFNSVAPRIPMLFAHDQRDTVGTWTDIVETDAGLQVKGRLLVGKVARADEVRHLILDGAVTGLSIGFDIVKASGTRGRRTIEALSLEEISIVAVPAHRGARISEAKQALPPASAHQIAAALYRAALALRS